MIGASALALRHNRRGNRRATIHSLAIDPVRVLDDIHGGLADVPTPIAFTSAVNRRRLASGAISGSGIVRIPDSEFVVQQNQIGGCAPGTCCVATSRAAAAVEAVHPPCRRATAGSPFGTEHHWCAIRSTSRRHSHTMVDRRAT